MIQLIDKLPDSFEYPYQFIALIERNLLDYEPWYFMNGEELVIRFNGIQSRLDDKSLIPFARRSDNDDIACWSAPDNHRVIVLHDFASKGWENRRYYDGFWDWYRMINEEMIQWVEENK